MKNYLAEAIQTLRPNAQFSFTNNDYSTIKWDFIDDSIPTENEINDAIEKIKQEESEAEAKIAEKKATAQAKLQLLGLTQEDLRALGLV